MQQDLLIKNATVLTLGKKSAVLHAHDILIKTGRIWKIAPTGSLGVFTGTVIDAHGKIAMPGLINAHMHFYSSFARGLSRAKPSKNFNEVLKNLWWKLDGALTLEDVYLSAMIALVDCIKKGTTTIIDHHASPGAVRGSLNQIARAVRETGLRASLCYEVSDRDGPQVAEDGILENLEFIQETRRQVATGDESIRALFGLHASFTLSDQTLSRAAAKAATLGAGFHIHAAEAKSDQDACLKEHGCRVVERFKKSGLLGDKTILAHGVHLSDAEISILAETNTTLVHNPQSNMNNAVGAANLIKLNRAGVRVGLGTDAMTTHMFEEVRVALWLQKHLHQDPSCGFMESLGALLFQNPEIADRYWSQQLGRLTEGGAADLILLDYIAPTPLDAQSLLGHLCFGVSHATVDTTIVGGRVLMQNKELKLPIDEQRLCGLARERAQKIWEVF